MEVTNGLIPCLSSKGSLPCRELDFLLDGEERIVFGLEESGEESNAVLGGQELIERWSYLREDLFVRLDSVIPLSD